MTSEQTIERLKRDAAKAALALLEDYGGAIHDTVWLDDGKYSPTLYDHLVGMTDVEELTGDVDKDKEILRNYSLTGKA